MDWSDDAIVLSARTHGENAAILEALTRAHGRHLGLVRGGNSRKSRPILQPGNGVQLEWRARLEAHLGGFSIELTRARAGAVMESHDALIGLNAACAVAAAALPEREPHPPLYDATIILFDALTEDGLAHWGPLYVRWELGLLEALGFGLDLAKCAATGGSDDLRFVSPRTGRAVSGEAGTPYASRLLALPGFLLEGRHAVGPGDIAAGLRLTGYFLHARCLHPHGKAMPPARQRLDALAGAESD